MNYGQNNNIEGHYLGYVCYNITLQQANSKETVQGRYGNPNIETINNERENHGI